ncbi:hypothetical protein OKW30_006033 [Paraburkholderia sp. Clong3]|uniref:hypothetical protein n=1 Tax=Paraburkholderia sp. Clong3 TaxID=2991061 RepID=UPI003D22F158
MDDSQLMAFSEATDAAWRIAIQRWLNWPDPPVDKNVWIVSAYRPDRPSPILASMKRAKLPSTGQFLLVGR